MRILQYAVRPFSILKYFGLLSFVLALMTTVPLAVSLVVGDYHVSLRYGFVIICMFILSASLTRLPAPKRLQTNEAMIVNCRDS